MVLEGANNFYENNNIILYTMNSPQTGQYCVVVPKNFGSKVSMLVDITKKSVFDSLISGAVSKEHLIEKIESEYNLLSNTYSGSLLVLPMLDLNYLSNIVGSGDKQKLFDETKKIGGITSGLYKSLAGVGVDKSRVDQKIIVVENGEVDSKFVEWLKGQMPNFVDGISLEELKSKSNESKQELNPFENVNPFTGESEVVDASVQPKNDIFGSQPAVEPVQASVDVEKKDDTFDIFGNQQPVQADVVSQVSPVSSGVEIASNVSSTSVVTETNQNVNPFEPQPVQSVSLNEQPVVQNTNQNVGQPVAQPNVQQPVNPVPETVVQSSTNVPVTPVDGSMQEGVVGQEQVNELDKKSGGFANLLILLVILIGVTFVSIELGKYLYNTFGV